MIACGEIAFHQLNTRTYLPVYVGTPYNRTAGQITVFRAAARPLLHSLEPDLGWSKLGGGRVAVEHIPGDHARILGPPYSQMLSARMTEALDRIAAEQDGKQTPQPGNSGE